MRPLMLLPFALTASLATSPALADIDVRVGAGGGACATASIQAAIDSANDINGVTNIKIASNQAYTAQRLNITGKKVRLIGGYANCTQAEPNGSRTTLSGAGGAADTVVTVLGSTTTVSFHHLEIIGGDEVTSSDGKGGGVAIGGGPHALVYFENTWIHDNQAGYGGGLWIGNSHSDNPADIVVWLSHNTRIYSNFGAFGGGGVWCREGTMLMTGGVAAGVGSSIHSNSTAGTVGSFAINGPGGGIRAENCVMNIASSLPLLGTIALNTAGGNGGGISVSGEKAIINLYTQVADRPTAIAGNIAGGVGGGIDIGSSATVNAWDIIIGGNTARDGGGGAALFDNDNAPDAELRMRHDLTGAPNTLGSREGVAVHCIASALCNRISDNDATTPGGSLKPGAAVRVSAERKDIDNNGARAEARLQGTRITGNAGESLIRVVSPGVGVGSASLNGTLIVGNAVSGTLLHNPDDPTFFGFGGHLSVVASTIADNVIDGNDVIRSTDGFSLKASIVRQAGKRVLTVIGDGIDNDDVDYLIAHDLTGLPPSQHNLAAYVLFEDPDAGDYTPHPGSPAIDLLPPRAGDVTADGALRVRDLDLEPNQDGAQDAGAIEKQNTDGYNHPPVVIAGATLTGLEDSILPIRGYSLSDPDGDIVGKLNLGVATSAGAIDAQFFGAVTVTRINDNNVSLTGPISRIAGDPPNNQAILDFYPARDLNGPVTLALTLYDLGQTGYGGPLLDVATRTLQITPVNDAPTLQIPDILRASSEAGTHTTELEPVSTISLGPANENGQSVQAWTLVSTSDPQGVLSAAPRLNPAGKLEYVLSGTPGVAALAARITDNGGVEHGGVDRSMPATFHIRVSVGGVGVFSDGFEGTN